MNAMQILSADSIRPTFFSFAGCRRAWEGYKPVLSDEVSYCDIWAYADVVEDIVNCKEQSALNATEASALVPNAIGLYLIRRAMLTFVPGTPSSLIEFVKDFNPSRSLSITRGERGVVWHLDRETGERHIRLASYHHALEDQMNDYVITPHETFGLLDVIRIHDSPYENVKMREVA